MTDLCNLALQNKALGTFMAALDGEFRRKVDECEMARSMLSGQRKRLKGAVTAALVRAYSGSTCSEIELLRKTNPDTNYGAYYDDNFSEKENKDFLENKCGDFAEGPDLHDIAISGRGTKGEATATSVGFLVVGVAFVAASAGLLAVEGRKSYSGYALKYARQKEDDNPIGVGEFDGGNDDGTLKDHRVAEPPTRCEETRTISAFTGNFRDGAMSTTSRNPMHDFDDFDDEDDGTIKREG